MATHKGYTNGSDLLIKIGSKAVGHCTSHTVNHSAETKSRSVKPVAAVTTPGEGKWQGKSITGLSVSVTSEGLRHYEESELSFEDIRKAWRTGTPVNLFGCERENQSAPSMVGSFVITTLDENAPAEDDATYSVTFENNGKVYFDEEITSEVLAEFTD